MFHWYSDRPMHGLPHVMFLYPCYTCIYGFFILVIWIAVHITCIIVPCYHIHVIWLLPIPDMDIPDTGHESCWYAICRHPHLLFPFPVILFSFLVILFYAINRALVQLSCYPYQVLYLFLLHCLLVISDHKATWVWGVWGRLDGWLDLIEWCTGSILFSHCRGW